MLYGAFIDKTTTEVKLLLSPLHNNLIRKKMLTEKHEKYKQRCYSDEYCISYMQQQKLNENEITVETNAK